MAARVADENHAQTTANGLEGLPQWLQPGVSPAIHTTLRVVLLSLNMLLLYCAVTKLFSPHFEIMFCLSTGLTLSYFWFMAEIASIHQKSLESGAERNRHTKKE